MSGLPSFPESRCKTEVRIMFFHSSHSIPKYSSDIFVRGFESFLVDGSRPETIPVGASMLMDIGNRRNLPIPNTFVDCSARPPFEQISSNPWWTCAMKNLFSFAFFIGSARPPEMIQSSPVGPCASTNSIPNTFVDCSARPQFEEILWNYN